MSDPHDRETYTQSLEARCDALAAENERLREALRKYVEFTPKPHEDAPDIDFRTDKGDLP